MMRAALLSALTALAACSAAEADVSPLEATIVALTPTGNAVAASTLVFGCPVERDDYAKCHACDVRVHDRGEEGVLAYATHWEHELKLRDGESALSPAITGEVADTKFTSAERSEAAAREVFGQAEAWCAQRGKGRYHPLKDEISAVFGGAR